MAIPRKVAAVVDHEDPTRVERVLDRELRAALTATRARRRLGGCATVVPNVKYPLSVKARRSVFVIPVDP